MSGGEPSTFQPVFVVGAPRSGTTFIQNLIATHPDVTTSPETNYFIHVSDYWLYHRNQPPLFLKPPTNFIEVEQAENLRLAILGQNPWIKKGPFAYEIQAKISIRNFSDAFFQSAMKEPERMIYLEKTPSHIYFVSIIQLVYPLAKYIHIVRDPRDTMRSYQGMLKLQGKPKRSAFEFSQMWKTAVRTANCQELFTVRYEDLVKDTPSEMNRIGTYLGLRYTPELLEKQNQISQKSVLDKEVWKANNFKSQKAFKKQDKLDPIGLKIVEVCCGKWMKHYGYKSESQLKKLNWIFPLFKQVTQYKAMRIFALMKRNSK